MNLDLFDRGELQQEEGLVEKVAGDDRMSSFERGADSFAAFSEGSKLQTSQLRDADAFEVFAGKTFGSREAAGRVACYFAGGAFCIPEYQADLLNASKFQAFQLGELTALCIDLLRDPRGSSFHERLKSFAETNGVKVRALKNVVRGVIAFFRGAAKHNLAPKQVAEDCVALGLTEEATGVLQEVWATNHTQLTNAQATKTIMANQLVDMEWKFGVTSATDEVDKIGSTFLNMKLVIDEGSGQREDVFMELSLQQFYEFMADMENAKSHLDFLSG
jgi:hypothetical protein